MTTKVPTSTREDILERAITLFAHAGFHGVSMRDIAAGVNIQAAALYHHFPDKQALYLAAMSHLFKDKSAVLAEALATPEQPLVRLNRFVDVTVDILGRNHELLALLQRERLDGDEARLKLIAEEVFAGPIKALTELAKELAPAYDPQMVAVSICALVMFHLETASIQRFIPGWRATHDNPEVIAKHVRTLLTQMFADGDQK